MLLRCAVVLVCLLLSGCYVKPPPPYESHYTPVTPTTPAAPPAIALPPNANAVFIGDSWTEGYSASPETRGYAYLTAEAMGWNPTVYAAASTGYTKGNRDGSIPRYTERIASLPQTDAQIVILQGSVNDFDTDKWVNFPALIVEAVRSARAKYPGAAVVVLGPCPYSIPATDTLRGLDGRMRVGSQMSDVHYVSCYGEQWINAENLDRVIDPDTAHPGNAGHAYLAERLVADLRSFVTELG